MKYRKDLTKEEKDRYEKIIKEFSYEKREKEYVRWFRATLRCYFFSIDKFNGHLDRAACYAAKNGHNRASDSFENDRWFDAVYLYQKINGEDSVR